MGEYVLIKSYIYMLTMFGKKHTLLCECTKIFDKFQNMHFTF